MKLPMLSAMKRYEKMATAMQMNHLTGVDLIHCM
jgi:hypothetical protein